MSETQPSLDEALRHLEQNAGCARPRLGAARHERQLGQRPAATLRRIAVSRA